MGEPIARQYSRSSHSFPSLDGDKGGENPKNSSYDAGRRHSNFTTLSWGSRTLNSFCAEQHQRSTFLKKPTPLILFDSRSNLKFSRQHQSEWRSTVENSHKAHRGEKLNTNQKPISTDFMKQGPSERSHANQYSVDELETSFNVDHLLESLILNQYMQPTANLKEHSASNLEFPKKVAEFDLSGALTSIKTEECVDLNPLLFDNSDEFFNEVENIESSCDATQLKGTYNYYVINKSESPPIIYTPENLSAAQSPSSVFDCITKDEEKMDHEYFGAPSGLDQFEFDDSTIGIPGDSNNIFNNSVMYGGSNVMISDATKRDEPDTGLGTPLPFDTPENSNGPSGFTMRRRGAMPSLPLTLFELPLVQPFTDEISTPDIINCIIESEKIDFSKGSQPKQLTLSNLVAEEIPSTSSSIIEVTDDYQELSFLPVSGSSTPITKLPPKVAAKKSRKRFYRDESDDDFIDDDEDKDYVPPAKTARKGKNWDNFQTVERLGKRGRPPKRAKSISSDDYSQLDPDEARYREMRDRNNEASRRSRYKRKKREELFGSELDVLQTENIRLQVQVEELQKAVDKYRDNLMQVMLSKR